MYVGGSEMPADRRSQMDGPQSAYNCRQLSIDSLATTPHAMTTGNRQTDRRRRLQPLYTVWGGGLIM